MAGFGGLLADTARRAEWLGHRLDGWRFRYGQASAACVRCDGGVLVGLADGTRTGVAAVLTCRDGGAELEAPEPVVPPSDGEALQVPESRQEPLPAPRATQVTQGGGQAGLARLYARVGARETEEAPF